MPGKKKERPQLKKGRGRKGKAPQLDDSPEIAPPEGLEAAYDQALKRLPPKRRKFVREYQIDCNATAAAKRAGYSPRTAYAQGHDLLKNPEVRAAVEIGLRLAAENAELQQAQIIQELKSIGFARADSYMTWGPGGMRLRDSEDLTPEEAAAVSEVRETITQHGGTIALKLHDKQPALIHLGKHFGMFKEQVELSGSVDVDFPAIARKLHGVLAGIAARQRNGMAGGTDG